MGCFWSFMAMLMVFMACFASLALPSQVHVQFSTISASPAVLPDAPLASSSPPTLSPDITPLFPTPRGMSPSPADSLLPTIPSSPSPPNPDDMLAPGPELPYPPSGSLPASSSVSLSSLGSLNLVLFIGVLLNAVFWYVRI